MEDSKLIAYYILQYKYLKQCGLDINNEIQVLKKHNQFFPDNWEREYSVDKKIKFISVAIDENKNLKEIVDKTTIEDYV